MCNIVYLYKITNKNNAKSYIGVTNNPKRRWKEHSYKTTYNKGALLLKSAFKKYGEKDFIYEILKKVDTYAEAFSLEKYFIRKYNTKVPRGYNLNSGGLGGECWTEEQKLEKSKKMRGSGNFNYGKKHSEETKKKMSDAKKKTPLLAVKAKKFIYFASFTEAKKKGFNTGGIGTCIKRKGTYKGYKWYYFQDFMEDNYL